MLYNRVRLTVTPYFTQVFENNPEAFYKAELLCYDYFAHKKILNFFFPWIEYKTLSIKEVNRIEDILKRKYQSK